MGAVVHRCVLSRHCVINPGAVMDECIVGQGVVIGENCKLRRVIVDSHNVIPPNTVIGYNTENDREKYHVDESGLVVVEMPKIQLRKNVQAENNSGFDDEMFSSF
jgi:glucose-1-phosphate adenylyltransferase